MALEFLELVSLHDCVAITQPVCGGQLPGEEGLLATALAAVLARTSSSAGLLERPSTPAALLPASNLAATGVASG